MVRDYVRFLPRDRDFNDFLTEFQDESDRAAAVLGQVYLEGLLSDLLTACFINDPSAAAEFLDDNRSLGNFSPKIRLAYLLGLISGDEEGDLHRIRKIRNHFAHERANVSFATPPVFDHCRAFDCIRERFTAEPELAQRYPDEPRLLFDLATALLAYYLIRRGATAKRAEDPKPVLWPKYDLPDERR